MAGTGTDANVVLLGDRILFGQDALFRLVVKFNAATEVLFRSHAHHLTLVQSHVVENIHLERPTQLLVLLLDENGQSVTTTLRIQTGVLQIVRIGIVFHQLWVSAPGKAAQRTTSHRRIVIGRTTDKGEFVETLVLTVGTIRCGHFFHVRDGQLQLFARMSLKHITTTGAFSLWATRLGGGEIDRFFITFDRNLPTQTHLSLQAKHTSVKCTLFGTSIRFPIPSGAACSRVK